MTPFTQAQFDTFLTTLKFPPNPFQLDVLKSIAFGSGNIVVSALAGSGKTSLLVQTASLLGAMGQYSATYLAFNKTIRDELNERLPKPFQAINSHSLGLRILKETQPKSRVDYQKWRTLTREMAENVMHSDNVYQSSRSLESLCSKVMLSNADFTDTDAIIRVAAHYNIEGVIDTDTKQVKMAIILAVKPTILKAIEIWRSTGALSFDEMIFLPVHLNLQPPQFDWVFVDESQDLNVLQQEIAIRSASKNGRMIFVGDKRQCVIDGTVIDETPVENIGVSYVVNAGRGKGIISPSHVTDRFSRYVEKEPVVTVTTKSGKQLTTSMNHMHFAGYVEGEGEYTPFFTYLMYREDKGYRIGVTRRYRSANTKQSNGFKLRLTQEKGDAIWILGAYDTEMEARYHEALFAAHYGLPTITFEVVQATKNSRSMMWSQEKIDQLYDQLDTRTPADRLLADMGMMHNYPHHRPKAMNQRRRRNVALSLGSDPRAEHTLHSMEMSGSDSEDAKILASLGLNISDNGKGMGWRCRFYSRNAAELHDVLQRIQQVMAVNVIQRARLSSGTSLPFCPASHVRKGMMIFVKSGDRIEREEITHVEVHNYTGSLHELNVANYHNYIANGIVTHNSIYGFAGADAYSFDRIIEKTHATVLPLNICYRCPSTHITLAQALVPDIQAAPNAKEGIIRYEKEEDLPKLVQAGNLVMCRLNAPLLSAYFALIGQKTPARILGKDIGEALIRTLDKVAEIDGFTYDEAIAFLDRYSDMQTRILMQRESNEAKIEAMRDQVECLIVCVENFACTDLDQLKNELKNLFGDDGEDWKKVVALCTVHKAKGLEADNTFILRPTKMPLTWPGQQPWEFEQELNIKYVALTRAKQSLTILGEAADIQTVTPPPTPAPASVPLVVPEPEEVPATTIPEVKPIPVVVPEPAPYTPVHAPANLPDVKPISSAPTNGHTPKHLQLTTLVGKLSLEEIDMLITLLQQERERKVKVSA